MIREAILTCAQKPTSQLNLPHVTKLKKWKKERLKSKKTDMLRSIGKQGDPWSQSWKQIMMLHFTAAFNELLINNYSNNYSFSILRQLYSVTLLFVCLHSWKCVPLGAIAEYETLWGSGIAGNCMNMMLLKKQVWKAHIYMSWHKCRGKAQWYTTNARSQHQVYSICNQMRNMPAPSCAYLMSCAAAMSIWCFTGPCLGLAGWVFRLLGLAGF